MEMEGAVLAYFKLSMRHGDSTGASSHRPHM